MCLYYSANFTGGYWGTLSDTPDLSGAVFNSWVSGSGVGQAVRNNTHSMACDSWGLPCYSYVYVNYSGNWDMVPIQTGGNLQYTLNNNASVRVI
jgi:hypothetical protein